MNPRPERLVRQRQPAIPVRISGTARWIRVLTAMTIALSAAACTVGPEYRRPTAPIPAAYKKDAGWREARPAAAIDRGAWWSVFKDPVLDALMRQVEVSNQNLKAAEAAFRRAEAVVAQSRATFFPTAEIDGSALRSRSPGFRGGGASIASSFRTTGSASWIPDLWGRIRRTLESDVATAQASAGDLAAARLATQAQLATAYMQLRVQDELRQLLDRSVKAYAESLRISQNQYDAGIVSASDVAQARTQLESTRSVAVATAIQRAQFENAIAVLIGKPPSEVSISPVSDVPPLPDIPAGLPSALLERRPDIAAAERRVAAANAQIGVAETAFFPDIIVTATSGFASTDIAKLLAASNRLWSFGSTLAQTVFDAGLRHAEVEQARADYDRDVALYRQTVLVSLQQVEDQLAALRTMRQQAAALEAAVAASREAERIINNQYLAGTVSYTDVVVAQTAALNNAQAALTVQQSRLVAVVALIEALGGGWETTQLPSGMGIKEDAPLNLSPLPPEDAWPKWKLW